MAVEAAISVYTIGHSNTPASNIVQLLLQHGVDLVVDVRSTPYSQYTPQFNRESFAQVLLDAGIQYKFAGDYLGGRPKDPTCYVNNELPDGKAIYLELVLYDEVKTRDWFLKAVARLEELAKTQRVAITCSEEDPNQCHRHHLIAQTLLERGAKVLHIRGDGTVETARLGTKRGHKKQAEQPGLPLIWE